MISFRILSIKRKLLVIINLITVISILCIFTFIAVNDIRAMRKDMKDNISSLTRVIGNYSKPELLSSKKTVSGKTLSSLAEIPEVEYACIFDAENRLFSEFGSWDNSIDFPDMSQSVNRFGKGYLNIVRTLYDQNKKLGTLYFKVSTSTLDEKIKNRLISMILIIIPVIMLSFLISNKLQKYISDPILFLSKITRSIIENKDISFRVGKSADDEIGILYDRFNNMLSQIQLKERELQDHYNNLEGEVEKRTKELKTSNESLLKEIIERKRAELILKKKEKLVLQANQMLQLVMDNIPQFIFWKDMNSVYIGCNKNFARAAGVGSPDNITGKTDYDLAWKKEEADYFRECDSRVMESDWPEFNIIEQQRQADGKQAWLNTNKIPLHDESGNIIGVLGTYEDITEKKRIEEALIESEKKYSRLVQESPDAIVSADRTGKLLSFNPTAERMSGFEKEELIGKHFSKTGILAGKSLHKAIQEFVLAIAGNERLPFELEVIRKDKSKLTAEANLRLVRGKSKNPWLQATFRDITKRKKVENALKQKEELFRSAIEAAGAVPYYLNYSGKKYEFIGEGIKNITGISKEEFCPGTWRSIIHEVALLGNLKNLSPDEANKAAQTGDGLNWRADYRIKLQDGGLCWLSDAAVPVKNQENKIVGSLGILQDITERKKAEAVSETLYKISKAVNDSRNLDKLYENIHKTLGTVIDVKNFFIALFYKEKDKIVFEYFIDEKDEKFEILNAKEAKSLTSHVINTKKPLLIKQNEIISQFNDGSMKQFGTIPEVWLGVPLKIKDEVFGAIGIQSYSNPSLYSQKDIPFLESISEQIALGIQQMKTGEDRRKLEEQLFQTQKMESIGRLAGGVAHDFNNILAGILGYAQLLQIKHSDISTSDGKAVNVICDGAKRAAEMTKQLLNFSRKDKHVTYPLNINTVIKSAIKITENIFEKKINVVKEFDNNVHKVDADENQLNQIFTNLIINARDAMPDGGDLSFVTKNVYLDKKDVNVMPGLKEGNYIKVSISDTGTGMTAEVKSKIFEPFFTTKESGKGTGIGLATVYVIVKKHNGHINVYSEPGKGTTFTIYLPVSKNENIKEESDIEILMGSGTILLVDDEEHIRSLGKANLEALGYDMFLAENGSKALDIYNEKKDLIDLVILDIIMPEMGGEETFYKLKEINPDVKVMLASGYSKEGTVTDLLNKGADCFIQKPYELHELSKILNDMLGKPAEN